MHGVGAIPRSFGHSGPLRPLIYLIGRIADHLLVVNRHVFLPPRLVDEAPPRSSMVKHDLKNQLGIILGFSDLMLAEIPDDDPGKPDLTEIRTASLIAMQLVNSLTTGYQMRGPMRSGCPGGPLSKACQRGYESARRLEGRESCE